jgi:potassium-transporting ATPase KdpC subunit
MFSELKRAVLFTVVTMVLFGGAYHVVLWGVGHVAFPAQANGSVIGRADGTPIGSSLIAQAFTQPAYFHPRPSAVDYNAASTGGSNYSVEEPDQVKAEHNRLAVVMAEDHVPASAVPSELITASGGGMDPDIPPDAAEIQAARVAAVRHVPLDRVRALIRTHTTPPTFGFLGRARVNVLELNRALDAALGAPPATGR